MSEIKLGIIGYGNLGKGVEEQLQFNTDIELIGVFSRRDPKTVSALYAKLLSTPFKDVKTYWEPFMNFATQQTIDVLASPEELVELDKAFESNEKNKLSID